jgi:hypothetical protein
MILMTVVVGEADGQATNLIDCRDWTHYQRHLAVTPCCTQSVPTCQRRPSRMTDGLIGTPKTLTNREESWDRENPEVSPLWTLGSPQVVPLGGLPRRWGLVGIDYRRQRAVGLLVPCRCVDRRRRLRMEDATQRAYGGTAIKCD